MANNEALASDLLLKRLYSNFNVLDQESCWEWNGVISKEGYGILRRTLNNKVYGILAHRLSWFTQYGKIPDGMVIDHTCHDPSTCVNGFECKHRSCVNPNHLQLTSVKDNVRKGSNVRSNVGICKNNIHKWIPENVKTWRNGKTVCLPCHRATTNRNAKKVGI
jgi:hypothetical protein